MITNECDLEVLRALTLARQRHGELTDLLDFYYDLYKVQFEAKADLPAPEVRDPVAMSWRLEGGIPQIAFDQLRVEPEPFVTLARRVGEVLLRHNPGWQVDSADWEPDGLNRLARQVFETWETVTVQTSAAPGAAEAPGAGVSTLAVGLALVPYLQRAAETIVPRLNLAAWTRGYCPICAGRPALALLGSDEAARQLVCSRCATMWAFVRVGCPFCRAQDEQQYYPSENRRYRLYVCQSCKRYLKTIDLGVSGWNPGPVQPLVERLLTIGMDLAAQQQGWGD